MRLPRWLMVSMFAASVLAILIIAVWWWVTLPQRTMIDLRESGDWRRLCSPDLFPYFEARPDLGTPKARARNVRAILSAKQEFDAGRVRYAVERSRVTDVWILVDADTGWISVIRIGGS